MSTHDHVGHARGDAALGPGRLGLGVPARSRPRAARRRSGAAARRRSRRSGRTRPWAAAESSTSEPAHAVAALGAVLSRRELRSVVAYSPPRWPARNRQAVRSPRSCSPPARGRACARRARRCCTSCWAARWSAIRSSSRARSAPIRWSPCSATSARPSRRRCSARFGAGAVTVVEQTEQRGTGHAVRLAMPALARMADGLVLVLYGDVPLLRRETLEELVGTARRYGCLALVTATPPDADRLRPHPARRARARDRRRRAEGRVARGARDHRDQRRHLLRAGRLLPRGDRWASAPATRRASTT